ncbi:MAG: glycerate kinase [Acidimicrobiia bacterium]|nr:glycerate kinase [Acidimicrobiia bacterium]
MKLVIAPDKFKGSLTGLEFCDAVKKGVKQVYPQAEIIKLPLADGGDGTIEILDYHITGEHIELVVSDPLFRPVNASYFFIPSTQTAFIEMAEASGMKLLDSVEQNCMDTTTYGTGELILDAIKKGAKEIVVGIGGSATNDCGIGMAAALGYKFLDKRGREVNPIGKNLSFINSIDASREIEKLKNVQFKVACDVTNPLYGKNGAAYVYASQKGASTSEVDILDQGLRHIAKKIREKFKIDVQNIEGGGAAGGMGVGTKMFLNATLTSGIELIKDMIEFEDKIRDSAWIITGEGKLDHQTLSGKTIKGVMDSAKNSNLKVAAFCGKSELNTGELKIFGISYIDEVMNYTENFDDAITNSFKYVSLMANNFAKKLKDL